MGKLFDTSPNNRPVSQREKLEKRYNSSVSNLLAVIIFSAINIVLLVTNADRYFLFSAFIPYFFVDIGMYYTGRYPAEYYYESIEYEEITFLYVAIAFATVVILLYLVSFLFARMKKVGWLIFSLVIFTVDTILMLLATGFAAEAVIDIILHIWIIVSLVIGIVTYFKIKKLPDEEKTSYDESITENDDENQNGTVMLRAADTDVKARIFLEAQVSSYHIVYRRVKRTNELVVNGRVYDEYVALAEFAHNLIAVIDGHKIEAGYDNTNHTYILFDGEQIARKIRLI